jgi:sulfur relay (sulfurtransferase) DsrF/TusC family protein
MSARAAVLMLALLFAGSLQAAEQSSLLVHVTNPLDGGSGRAALVFRVVAAAMQKGQHVSVLFDAEGVASLKMGRWFGGHSTPIDRIEIRDGDREDLAKFLGTTPAGIPDIYGSLLHFLKGRGLAVYVNERALELQDIDEESFDHAAEAVTEEQMLELLSTASVQVTY